MYRSGIEIIRHTLSVVVRAEIGVFFTHTLRYMCIDGWIKEQALHVR